MFVCITHILDNVEYRQYNIYIDIRHIGGCGFAEIKISDTDRADVLYFVMP